MASFFQYFSSSQMPKRLLRFALSKFDILDSDALDTENLDFVLGRNTVLEFRDVGINLKKLESLLQLPPSLKFQKAKASILRISIPIDFYAGSIVVEVDGIIISLQVAGLETKRPEPKTAQEDAGVPNTVDLAHSFLEAQPTSDRKELEEAIAAEAQDLAASASVSEDGSDDDALLGTGQTLTLPTFLAGFLQGVADRTQIRIKGVALNLDVDVAVDPLNPNTEPVSFQVALDGVDIEGVTTQVIEKETDTRPLNQPKEGKRLVSLNNLRAYLISEANVFSAFAQSPTTASPSLASSPALTRNPPSRETSHLSQDQLHEAQADSILQQSLGSLSSRSDSSDSDGELGDSEDALGIPYNFSEEEEPQEEDGPATPRASVYLGYDESPERPAASVYHEFEGSPEESMFHSTVLPAHHLAQSTAFEGEVPQWASTHQESRSEPALRDLPATSGQARAGAESPPPSWQEAPTHHATGSDSGSDSVEDLTQSHLYTHEEAESMYMSAFSNASSAKPHTLNRSIVRESEGNRSPERSISPAPVPPKSDSVELQPAITRQSTMPGGWDDGLDSIHSSTELPAQADSANTVQAGGEVPVDTTSTEESSIHPERTQPGGETSVHEVIQDSEAEHEDAATPRGTTRLMKELLTLDRVSVYIPSSHRHVHVGLDSDESVAQLSQSLAGSMHPQAPGAFSVHGASAASQRPRHREQSQDPPELDRSIEVELSPVSIKFDASLGFLLATVVGKLLDVIKPGQQPPAAHANTPKSEEKTRPEFKVLFQEISINFINQLGGVADNLTRSLDPAAFILSHEVLLNATLQKLSIHSSTKSATASSGKGQSSNTISTVTTVEVETFRFGYETGDIISFNKTQPMSTSIRDVFLSTGWDIGIKITTSGGVSRTDIETLPLLVHLDLQRLDDTFSWFGGLSSFLNMSASMTSNPANSSKSISPQATKPKGIRFELPLDPEKSAASENKVNLRIGGTRLEIQGGVCSVVAETSTIKAVSRDEGVGLTIRSLRVVGPYLRNSRAEPAILAEVNDVRLEYLNTPKGPDIEQLLALVSPSNHNFVENGQDELMVDNLIMQRRKGPVLRVNVDKVNVRVKDLAQLDVLPALGEEVAKLSTVAKYLPEDDRPGLLTLGKIGKVHLSVNCGGRLGQFSTTIQTLDAAHIPAPFLVGVSAHGIEVHRNEVEELVSVPSAPRGTTDRNPALRVRMIGDEIEPVVRFKLHRLAVEYRVPFIMDILGLQEDATPQDFEAELAASVANLGDQAHIALQQNPATPETQKQKKPMVLKIGFHDCLIGLNPLNLPAKMIVALADAHLDVVLPNNDQTKVDFNVNKSSILLIDDVSIASEEQEGQVSRRKPSSYTTPQVLDLCARGFAPICYISSAKAVVNVVPDADGEKQVEVEVSDDLFVLETCADSTQTLITLINALKPPTPPSKEEKYRTGIMPMEDLLSSISAEAFGNPEGEYDFDQDFAGAQEMAGSHSEAASDSGESLRIKSQYYGSDDDGEELFDAMKSSGISHGSTTMQDTAEGVLLTGFRGPSDLQSDSDDDLVIHDDFYKKESTFHGTAKIWNWSRGSFDSAPVDLVRRSPFKVNVKDVHFTWNLFDGYDWVNTRDVITKAVHEVEQKAMERHFDNDRNKVEFYEEEIEDDNIGDCLFNSIYIGIASNRDPRDLTRAINEDLNDNATETESIATTSYSGATNRTARPHQAKSKRLRLGRSRHHKITFDLQGVSAHVIVYPSDYGGETRSAIDVRVKNLDIVDHVHTSTWKKFATYDQDAGEREMGTSMVQLEMLNVRPMAEVVATEMVLRVKVLPLRLHVDQDALEFITRFFEFKDDKVPVHSSPSDVPFIQRVEIFDVPVKLDFKPKRVDYTGLRSGRTTEFMNFIIMDESKMVLKHIILHGISGFDRMGKMLNDLWMENVKKNQLPTVLAGLAPVKSLVNIGSGFKDLIEVPIREYKKDGRAIRSISKGAVTFARNTGTELIKFGAKLAVGTQYALQGAEGMLSDQRQPQDYWDDDDLEPGERRQISLYADQPTSVMQGLRGGYRSLARDISLARDAIVAVPGEVMQSQSPGGAAAAVLKRAPTIVFRPAMGVSKVVGQTLMGATNAIDPQQQRRIEEKYKKY